jgi:lysophospholipase L1-like esterase
MLKKYIWKKSIPRICINWLPPILFFVILSALLLKQGQFLSKQSDLLQQQTALLKQQGDLLQQQTDSSQQQTELLQRQSNLLQQQINPSQQHISIRQFMVNSHLAQINEDRILFIGDSIVEGWLNEEIGQCKVLNIGFGSGRVSDVLAFLDELEATVQSGDVEPSYIKSMVILIGVNDARKLEGQLTSYIDRWSEDYEKMLSKALELSLGEVMVATILPVGENMPLGDLYFDSDLIEAFNNSIRAIAERKEVNLIDAGARFIESSGSTSNAFTTDGVHLNAEGYQILDSIITPNLEECIDN